MRTYRNMKSRVTGVQKKKYHLYAHSALLGKEEFYDWALQDGKFMAIYYAWVFANYDQRFSPSIDRIDSSKGYTPDNCQFVLWAINVFKGDGTLEEMYEIATALINKHRAQRLKVAI